MSNIDADTNKIRVLAFGEVLWDMLPTGPKLGGAPVNFLYHAQTLGADAMALTRVGNDQLGRDVVERFRALKLPTNFLQISECAPTGSVVVTLDEKGNPSYEIVENVAWDEIEADDSICSDAAKFLATAHDRAAFYFGSLALRSRANREAFERLEMRLPDDVLRVCDLNLRPPFYSRDVVEFALQTADVFKLNDVEAITLDALFHDQIPSALQIIGDATNGVARERFDREKAELDRRLDLWARSWMRAFDLKSIVLTCGANGAYLFNGDVAAFAPAPKTVVKDAVGAGDAFAATTVVGLLQRRDEAQIVAAAAKRAAFVCSQEGGTPPIPAEFADPFNL